MAVKQGSKKKKKWIHFRHKAAWKLLKGFAYLTARVLYGYRFEKVSAKEYPQALILCNHQNDFDPFFLGVAFRDPVYYIANETLFSTGFFGKFLSWIIAPIPIKKNTSDMRAVANLFQVAKEGGNIGIFPEGNTCIAGKSVYIKKTVAPIAKKLKIPLILYRLEGGYGIKPRWSDSRRKGRVTGRIERIISPDELAKMSADEIYEAIVTALDADEHKCGREFFSGRMAEGAERILYVCPACGLSKMKTHLNRIYCEKCGAEAEFVPDLSLKSTDENLRFADEGEWYEYQQDYIRSLDLSAYLESPAYEEEVSLYSVVPYRKKEKVADKIRLLLFSDRMVLGEKVLSFSEVEGASIFKANILVLTMKSKEVYQVIGNKEFNAVKFVNFIAHFQKKGMYELTGLKQYEGECDVEFLGI